MKLLTFRLANEPNNDHIGAMLDDVTLVDLLRVYALRYVGSLDQPALQKAGVNIGVDMRDLISRGDEGLDAVRGLVEFALQGNLKDAIFNLKEIIFRPPIPRPGKIIAMGRNFSDHAAESVEGLREKLGREVKAPQTPMGFIKPSSSVIAHEEPIIYPHVTKQLDYEVEMAIVIGASGRYIQMSEAYNHIAGYSILNDVSARDIQLKEAVNGPFLLGKGLDTCGPFGPFLVTRDEVENPHSLGIRLKVNGETRQDSTTKKLIFDIPESVAYWSQMTLEPGDVITTGTPEGVALWRKPDPSKWFLKPGDIVEAEVDCVGVLRNPVVAED